MNARALNTAAESANPRKTYCFVITCSEVMHNVFAPARSVSNAAATVLIQGEGVTGKEMLARYIHQQSGWGERSFVLMYFADLPVRMILLIIPSLREGKEDIPVLAEHFIEKFCPPDGKPTPQFRAQALEQMISYDSPGNGRELENTVELAMLIGKGQYIGPKFLRLDDDITGPGLAERSNLVGMTVRELEQKLIGQTLRHVNDSRSYATKIRGSAFGSCPTSSKNIRKVENLHSNQRTANDGLSYRKTLAHMSVF